MLECSITLAGLGRKMFAKPILRDEFTFTYIHLSRGPKLTGIMRHIWWCFFNAAVKHT